MNYLNSIAKTGPLMTAGAYRFLWIFVSLSWISGCGTPALTVDEMIERAAALCDRGRGAEALQLLDLATAKEELLPDAYYLKGLAHEINHEFDQAKRCYDRCLEQFPEDSDALNNRGAVQLRLDNLAEAQADLMRSTQINPNDDLAWANLALVQQELRKWDDAKVSLQRAIAVNKNATHFLQLGNLLIDKLEYVEAEQALTESIGLSPHNASAYLSRAIARARLDRTQDAEQDLESARASDAALSLQASIQLVKQSLPNRR